jgi:acyl-CoA reductase-like NAD-dependent aldehyde dehydrogenase
MNNAGQVCISVERCYVEAPIYDEFLARVTETVRGLRQGEPTGVGTVDVGAVIFPPQMDIVEEHVRDAVAKGAKVVTGGHGHSETGVVCVDDAQVNYTALNLPMGGWKSSGIGTRHGSAGIRKYTKVQSLLVTRRALKREPFMFPYKKRQTMLLRSFLKLFYGRGRRD